MIKLFSEESSSCSFDANNLPEGLTIVSQEKFTYGDKTYMRNEYKRHEIAPARFYNNLPKELVASINDQNYLISIDIGYDRYDDRIPYSATVCFEKTDLPETEYHTWNEEEAIKARRDSYVKKLVEIDQDFWSRNHYQKQIDDIDAGNYGLIPPYYLQLFGQPQFIQGEIFPVHNGKLAYHLATLNTEWGDSGNVNILFACDDAGKPCEIWFEASCC